MRKIVIAIFFIMGLMLTACGSMPTEDAPAAPTVVPATEEPAQPQATAPLLPSQTLSPLSSRSSKQTAQHSM